MSCSLLPEETDTKIVIQGSQIAMTKIGDSHAGNCPWPAPGKEERHETQASAWDKS